MAFTLIPAADIDLSQYFVGAFATRSQVLQTLRALLDLNITTPQVADMSAGLRKRLLTACDSIDGLTFYAVENGANVPTGSTDSALLCVEPLCTAKTVKMTRKNAKTGKKVEFSRTFEKVEKLRLTLVPKVETQTK
jgi:hypothetical protein